MDEVAKPDIQVVCSSITFRHRSLEDALHVIRSLDFGEIDLGALPGVCDHVPAERDDTAIATVAAQVRASGLAVRSINADVGDLNAPLDAAAQLRADTENALTFSRKESCRQMRDLETELARRFCATSPTLTPTDWASASPPITLPRTRPRLFR